MVLLATYMCNNNVVFTMLCLISDVIFSTHDVFLAHVVLFLAHALSNDYLITIWILFVFQILVSNIIWNRNSGFIHSNRSLVRSIRIVIYGVDLPLDDLRVTFSLLNRISATRLGSCSGYQQQLLGRDMNCNGCNLFCLAGRHFLRQPVQPVVQPVQPVVQPDDTVGLATFLTWPPL